MSMLYTDITFVEKTNKIYSNKNDIWCIKNIET